MKPESSPEGSKMRALIYGGGAVGLGVASCLIRSGEDVEIIAREGTVSALRKGGLIRTGIFGSLEFGPPELGFLKAGLLEFGPL